MMGQVASPHMTSVNWSAVQADDFTIPPDQPLPELITELSEMLRSPKPEIRDSLAYSTLAAWIIRGNLPRDRQTDLGDRMAARFTDQAVQARTFAPLILACLADRGLVEDRWVNAFEQWYPAEADLRGYDPSLGWLHAVAHGADLLGELGMITTVAPQRMLQLAAARLTRPTDFVWRDQEDDRLGYAIAQTLTRDDLGPAEATAWLDAIEGLIEEPPEVPIPANVSNTLRTLRSLYILLGTGVRVRGQDLPLVPKHAPLVKGRLVEVLHHRTPWMW
jgi:hypothetical protein